MSTRKPAAILQEKIVTPTTELPPEEIAAAEAAADTAKAQQQEEELAAEEHKKHIGEILRKQAQEFLTNVTGTLSADRSYLTEEGRLEVTEKAAILTSTLAGDDDEKVAIANKDLQESLDAAIFRHKENSTIRRINSEGGKPIASPFVQGHMVEVLTPENYAEGEATVEREFPKAITLTVTHWEQIHFKAGINKVPVSLANHPWLLANGMHEKIVTHIDESITRIQTGELKGGKGF